MQGASLFVQEKEDPPPKKKKEKKKKGSSESKATFSYLLSAPAKALQTLPVNKTLAATTSSRPTGFKQSVTSSSSSPDSIAKTDVAEHS